MTLDTIDSNALKVEKVNIIGKLKELNNGFEFNLEAKNGIYENMGDSVDKNIAGWVENIEPTEIAPFKAGVLELVQEMFNGKEVDGKNTVGLNEVNRRYNVGNKSYASLKQQSGYTAEIINCTKENIENRVNRTGIRTIRTDDLPKNVPESLKEFCKCDPYTDLIRINENNEVVERVQVKYVGKDAADCLSKLMSKKYEKYLEPNKIDKYMIPKDFYDKIKNEEIPNQRAELEKQISVCKEKEIQKGLDTATAQLDKINKIDELLEKGSVTSKESMNATKHPKIYQAKLFTEGLVKSGNSEGIGYAKYTALITGCVSTVDNVSKVYQGKIEADEAVVNIIKDTGVSTITAYGTGFATGVISQVARESGHQFIRNVGNSCLPMAAVSMAVESYDEIADYTNGGIDEYELAEKLGKNAVTIAGGINGAAIGSAVIPVPVVGGIVGGVVGCAVASGVYDGVTEIVKENAEQVIENVGETVEYVADKAGELVDKAQEMAGEVVDFVDENVPEALNDVKNSIGDFASNMKNQFKMG